MTLVDTHCHPYLPPLDVDPDAALARARGAGVGAFVVPEYDDASATAVAALAAAHPDVHPACGRHPWAAAAPCDLGALEARLRAPGVVAVGEIGLDAKVDVDLARQTALLRDQLALARELDLPVILHGRGAFEELLSLLAEHAAACGGAARGVVHAFSRGPELAGRFLGLGLHLGLGGAITRPRARRPRRVAATAPLERLVLETDAPSIGLDGVAAGASEPRHVGDVAAALAGLRQEDPATIARATSANARDLFGF